MASAHEEYLYHDEFDAVLDIIESDFWNVVNFNKIWIWQLKKYLCSITHRPVHVLFAPKFAFQKVDSPGISALNIT